MPQFTNRQYPQDASKSVPDLVCLSHLRWDFVYQRPQHLLSRFARERRVFFIEEPVFDRDLPAPHVDVSPRESGVQVVVPHLPEGVSEAVTEVALEKLINQLFAEQQITEYVLWYYTPMALGYTRHLNPLAVVYDCMDELSMFKFAPTHLKSREAELFRRADLVFTGGASLYELKRAQHSSVHLFPSGIDFRHFAQAREAQADPADQADIPHPRLGFFGVVDERMDLELLGGVAEARPDWNFVIIGPVVKIDPESLPRHPNIHYLGAKSYRDLPAYLSGWDVALLPFARNDSTRFISPTKTPEYLAGGKPVVSTSIRDVVHPYGDYGLVWIGDTIVEFSAAVERALRMHRAESVWQNQVDEFLAQGSWDQTWARMRHLIDSVIDARAGVRPRRHTYPAAVATAGD